VSNRKTLDMLEHRGFGAALLHGRTTLRWEIPGRLSFPCPTAIEKRIRGDPRTI
jgi:hypothetical protein